MPPHSSLPALNEWHCVLAQPSHPDRSSSVFLDMMDWHKPPAEPRIFLSIFLLADFQLMLGGFICFLLQLTLSFGVKNIGISAYTGHKFQVFFPAPVCKM